MRMAVIFYLARLHIKYASKYVYMYVRVYIYLHALLNNTSSRYY